MLAKFLKNLSEQPRKKIYYNISKVAGGIKDSELFKKLDGADDLWKFRTLYKGLQYRLIAFWDKKSKRLVVATHGFVKKTWKTGKIGQQSYPRTTWRKNWRAKVANIKDGERRQYISLNTYAYIQNPRHTSCP